MPANRSDAAKEAITAERAGLGNRERLEDLAEAPKEEASKSGTKVIYVKANGPEQLAGELTRALATLGNVKVVDVQINRTHLDAYVTVTGALDVD